jgi:hypothetical protein
MKPSTTGQVQPDLIEMDKETKTRTYKNPDGESFTISEEDFSKVVEIFDYLRNSRDSKNTQMDTLEPESCAQVDKTVAQERVG